MNDQHRRLIAATLVAGALVAAGCSGPRQDLEVDVRGQLAELSPADARTGYATLPLPPYVDPPGTSGTPPRGWLVDPDLAAAPRPAPTGSRECPFTDPRQSSLAPTEAPTSPPAEGRYDYFAQGRYESVSASGGRTAVMPTTTSRSVENVRWGPGDTYYDFDLVAQAAHSTTRTRYRVVLDDPGVTPPDVPRPVNVRQPLAVLGPETEPAIVGTVRVGTPAQPGMYVLSVQSGNAAPVAFNGGVGMLLVRWPAYPGNTLRGQASVGGLHLTYTSTVLAKGKVEACGALLDSRAVRIQGTATPADGSGTTATYDATYNVATQFGGLVIADARTTTVGSDATSSVVETVSARIKGKPRPATPPRPQPACPAVPAGAQPLAAGDAIERPPVEGTYRMTTPPAEDAVSTYQIAGLDPDAGKLPTTLVRTVRDVRWSPDRAYFEYDTADNVGGSVTTTRYRVVPGRDATKPPAKPRLGDPGMYLVATTYPDGRTLSYNGGRGLLIVPFPLDPAAQPTYTMTGSDGRNEVVAASYVSPAESVAACGELVQGWRVDVSIVPGTTPAPRPTPTPFVDTRLLPPPEPPLPSASPKPPAGPVPPQPTSGPRSQLVAMRSYTDLLHDDGHVKATYSFTIAPQLGGLIVTFRATVSSVGRQDVFQQNSAYSLSSKPKVPAP